MATINIIKGENFVLRRDLQLADNSPLLVATLTELKADLIQNGVVIKNYTYPSSELRDGTTTSQIELEIKEATSLLLSPGMCQIRWYLKRPNAVFQADTFQKDIISEDNLVVILK